MADSALKEVEGGPVQMLESLFVVSEALIIFTGIDLTTRWFSEVALQRSRESQAYIPGGLSDPEKLELGNDTSKGLSEPQRGL